MKFLARLYFLKFQSKLERNKILYDIIFLSLYFFLYVLQLQSTIILSYIVAAIYAFFFLNGIKTSKQIFQIYSIVAALFLLSIINFNHGFTPLFHLIFLPVILLIAHYFSKKQLVDLYQIFRAFQYQNIFLVTLGLLYNYNEIDPIGSIIPWVSRNGITSVLLVCQIIFSFVTYLYNKRFPIISSLLVVIISFYGLGRGSIIVSILLLLYGIFLNIANTKSKLFKISSIIGVIVLLFYFSSNTETITLVENIEDGLNKTQFGQGYTDEARTSINNEYISRLDTWNFIFGSSYINTSIEKNFGGNPHNSFIRLHSYYGIFGIIVLFLLLISILIAKKNASRKFVLFGLLLLLLFRAYTEPILFPSSLDLFFLIMIALFFRKKDLLIHERNLTSNSYVN
jgi:hypothetical protein